MKFVKTLAMLCILLFLVSTASAACYKDTCSKSYAGYGYGYGCHKYNQGHCNYGRCGGYNYNCNTAKCNQGYCNKRGCSPCKNINKTVPPITPSNNSGVTLVKLCKNNVCTVGANGKVLVLKNYKNATDPTYDQLITFLQADKTDERAYTSGYQCGDFAATLHNNAEAAGIRAGWVGAYGCNHAFNMFQTTDRGLVYIDCTGVPGGAAYQDKQLNVEVGQPLTGTYLFSNGGTVNVGCTVTSLLEYW